MIDKVLESHQKWKKEPTTKNYDIFMAEVRKKSFDSINQQNIIPKSNIDDREDVVEDVCEIVINESTKKSEINGGYVYTITKNKSLDYLEKAKVTVDIDKKDYIEENNDSFDELKSIINNEEFFIELKKELTKQRINETKISIFYDAFSKTYFENQTYKEIADFHKLTEQQIKDMFRSNSKYITAVNDTTIKIASENGLEIHLTKNNKPNSVKEPK
ncbi:MAG: sigma-70 family RNA polymerase sigma factor [Bacteroidetes bacterium]|nr:MAG: sigma-70 family RNA polymerase sigma factor [Bacteroidota bacterium]